MCRSWQSSFTYVNARCCGKVTGARAGAHLTCLHWADRSTVCGGVDECELVQTSEYSDVAGVPVAFLGLLYFVAMSLLAAARISRMPGSLEWAQSAAFSLVLAQD